MNPHLEDALSRSDQDFSLDHWIADADHRPANYHLAVLASSSTKVVEQVGGWLFDVRAAGWEVTACVTEDDNRRALDILGVAVIAHRPLAETLDAIKPYAVATSIDDFREDSAIRASTQRLLKRRHTHAALWGPAELPGGFADRLHRTTHRLSLAGRAFKRCALVATGDMDATVDATEGFWTTKSTTRARPDPQPLVLDIR
ncbi:MULTISPECIES: hypothetical protein [Nocardia]|uniref:hypothetical protein n=1 Tax=Nocardia TaxID=1817 RepID=UPI000D69BB3C|nr:MULTISPECIES: hypothetical protein [Nocardia]